MGSTKLSSLNLMFLIVLFCTLVFVIANVALNHWMFLEERKRERLTELEKVTFSLAAQFPYSTFRGIAADKGAWLAPEVVQVAAINEALQPIVDTMALSHTNIKMGFYSLEHSSVVAIAPNFNPALLRPEERFRELEDIQLTGAAVTGLAEWDGKPVMYAVAPIFHQGRIIGFSFADMQTENIRAEAIARTTYISLAAVLLVLSFVATVFAGFEKLKNDLRKFAVSIASGEMQSGQTSFPELQPILNLIKGQALTLARLDRLNLMGEIAASIGHEVRNPMTTVRGFLQYLAAKEDLAKYRSQFALMQAELDRANSILTEFLSLSKERTIELKPMNLRAVIEGIVPLLEADALHANCALQLQLDKTPDILLDEKEMRQMLLNFFRNALEAMPQGGTVTISTFVHDGKIVLSIRDEGEGIPPAVRERIGTPFVTTKEKGTGLGLSVCHRIAERHRATIRIESQEGRGTTVEVLFPVNA